MKCKTLYFSSKKFYLQQNDHFLYDMTGTNNLVSKNSIIKNACRGSGVKFLKKNQHLNFFNFAVILGGRGGQDLISKKLFFFTALYFSVAPNIMMNRSETARDMR